MPGNIYYLIASLPHLSYPDLPTITIDTFLSACKINLSPFHMKKLESIKEGEFDKKVLELSVVRLWQEWDSAARSELARLRAEKLGRPAVSIDDYDGRISSALEAAQDAFRASSPLVADDAMESARWDYLDSLEFGRYFNLESLVLYLLKLKVMERRAGLVADCGRTGFAGVLERRNGEIESVVEAGINSVMQ